MGCLTKDNRWCEDIPFGRWKTRGYLRTVPGGYLIFLRRNIREHNGFRWAVASEINRRRLLAESLSQILESNT